MLGFYNYTVVLTYIGMLISFFGITFAVTGNLQNAVVCLMLSGICDMFDGKIASTKSRTEREKRFGIQIDSLSDLICFGALPALIVWQLTPGGVLRLLAPAFYLLCALIRLAFFNVDEEERQSKTQSAREVYYGLPVTTIALILPALVAAAQKFALPIHLLGPAFLLVVAVAFLTPFELRKPALLGKIGMIVFGSAEFLILLGGFSL